MGLKSGSRDAGLDEEESDDEPTSAESDERTTDEARPDGEQTDEETAGGEKADEETEGEPTDGADASPVGERPTRTEQAGDKTSGLAASGDGRPSVESLPYVLRRNRVNEGRDQVPFFLREEVVEGERELRETLETTLGEDVYKSDYREAAMVVAQEHPELVAEVLRRWGYDLS